jgi:hypothetical protein
MRTMTYDHPYLVRKLRWFDRYAIYTFKTSRGGLLILPSLLVLAPAILVTQLSQPSRFSAIFLWVSLVAAGIVALFFLGRAIHVYRMELHHERHLEAFWNRKLQQGGFKMWLMMAAQLAILIAALVAIGYTSR